MTYIVSTHSDVPGFTSEARHMNANGTVVGILHAMTMSKSKAFVWGTGITTLPDKGFGAEARAINATGQIAGAVETQPGRLRAAVWSPAHTLALLTEPADSVFSFTHGLANDGRIVGGYIKPGPHEVPLWWQNAGSAPVAAPTAALWSEALSINDETSWACGSPSFMWNVLAQLVDLGNGEAHRIRGAQNEVYGVANDVPVQWHGGAPSNVIPLDGLTGHQGAANDANRWDEIVGTVFPPFVEYLTTPFLRRGFRRDEVDPSSSVLFPTVLHLAQPETIDLNTLLPAGSGWQLSTAEAINIGGQITGTGTFAGAARAYRLSPPQFDQPLVRLLTLLEFVILIGGVAAGGGGFGILSNGHIIPIPPPRPDVPSEADVREQVRKAIRQLAEHAPQETREKLLATLKVAVDEATKALKAAH